MNGITVEDLKKAITILSARPAPSTQEIHDYLAAISSPQEKIPYPLGNGFYGLTVGPYQHIIPPHDTACNCPTCKMHVWRGTKTCE